MAPILYSDLISPCCRSVVLVIRAAGLEDVVQVKPIQLFKGEHLEPEFVKKFPLHCVPALEDGDLFLWDSHAILPYILSAYAKTDTLYPKDLKKRAKVDQWLHFANTTLYNRLRDMTEPLWRKKSKVVSEEKSQRAEEAFKMLEEQIGDRPWLCGESLTLADICCVVQINGIEIFVGNSKYYPKMTAWVERCKSTLQGFEEICEESNEQYRAIIRKMMSS